jgi:hypothetical protein
MKKHNILFGLVVALIASFSVGFTPLEEDQGGDSGIFFSSDVLYQILAVENCNAVRFYHALNEGSNTLIAVAVNNGADISSAGYIVSYGVNDGQPQSGEWNKESAKTAVTNLGEANRYAVTIPREEIIRVLSHEGATGIVLEETQAGDYTSLSAKSANIPEGRAMTMDGGAEFTVTSPCPSSCGMNPSTNYLLDLR